MATTNDDGEVIIMVLALLFAIMLLSASGNKIQPEKKQKDAMARFIEKASAMDRELKQQSIAGEIETSAHTWQQVSGIRRHAINHLDEADRILN